jgi:hypothetical protein
MPLETIFQRRNRICRILILLLEIIYKTKSERNNCLFWQFNSIWLEKMKEINWISALKKFNLKKFRFSKKLKIQFMINILITNLISRNEETIYDGIYYNHYNSIERSLKNKRKIYSKWLTRIYLILWSFISSLKEESIGKCITMDNPENINRT